MITSRYFAFVSGVWEAVSCSLALHSGMVVMLFLRGDA